MEMETQFPGDLGPLNLYPMTVITPNQENGYSCLRQWRSFTHTNRCEVTQVRPNGSTVAEREKTD